MLDSTTLVLSAVTMSVYKPIIIFATMVAWGRWLGIVSLDAKKYEIKPAMWNGIQLGVGIIAFALWLLIPFFWLGLPLALLLIAGAGAGYAFVRNPIVPKSKRWGFDFDKAAANREKKTRERATDQASISFLADGREVPVPMEDDKNYDAHQVVQMVFTPIVLRNANRIEIAGTKEEFAVKYYLDTVAYPFKSLKVSDGMAMLKYLQEQCGLDVEERRRMQVGKTEINTESHGRLKLEVTTAGSTSGVQLLIEIDPEKQRTIPLDELGIGERQKIVLEPVLAEGEGVVLFVSPSRQGRSTTFYSVLDTQDPYLNNIHIMTPRLERDLEGITTHEVTNEEQPGKLKSLLLREPDIVAVAELAGADSAKLLAGRATEEKNRSFVGMKANDTFAALKTWVKAVGSLGKAADSLDAIIAQRLVRVLCENCRTAYAPDQGVLRKLNLPKSIEKLYKATGKVSHDGEEATCPMCSGTGYHGVTAVFEVMILDDDARDLIRAKDLDKLRTLLRKRKMMMLQEAGIAKVVAGRTDIRELGRVFK